MDTALDAYWIQHCHGFRVDTPNGRLGVVEDVLFGAERDRPSALVVRTGLFGTRVEITPVEEVAAIEPRRKRLTLARVPRQAAA